MSLFSAYSCGNGKVYQECGHICNTGCYNGELENFLNDTTKCEKKCLEGCFCPHPLVEHNGELYSIHDVDVIVMQLAASYSRHSWTYNEVVKG